jgi:hypothetical protein
LSLFNNRYSGIDKNNNKTHYTNTYRYDNPEVNSISSSEANAIGSFTEVEMWNFTGALNKIQQHEVLWDTLATLGVTHNLSDFVSAIETSSITQVMKGIAKGLTIEGIGEIDHMILTEDGSYKVLRTPTYYIP